MTGIPRHSLGTFGHNSRCGRNRCTLEVQEVLPPDHHGRKVISIGSGNGRVIGPLAWSLEMHTGETAAYIGRGAK